MGGRYSARLAWSLWVLAILLLPGVVLQISLNWAGPMDIPFAVGFVAVQLGAATTGAIISSRLPGNAVGWIFLAMGLLLELLFAVGAYAELGIDLGYGSLLPGSRRNIGRPNAAGMKIQEPIQAATPLPGRREPYPQVDPPTRRRRPRRTIARAEVPSRGRSNPRHSQEAGS